MDEAFGRYRLLSLIGEGAMGKVYKAHDTVIGRDVAIKVLPTELSAEPGYRERFRREAHTAARLTEPHIIPIHDTGETDDGHLYLVMPVIDGVDLHSLLQRDGPMSPQRAVHVIEQLAAALDAAHEAGLVHRDIKPSNALMTRHDFVYLIDFGIAHDAAATKLTSTGMMMGTLAYMAPERFTTGTADARADVYSLACVLYECLTGATPYPGDSIEQQIAGHLTLEPPKPSSLSPDIPAGFDEVIAAGMAKNPDQRYQTAQELADAARHALTEVPTPAPPAPAPSPPDWPPAPQARPADPTPTQIGTPPQRSRATPQQPLQPAPARRSATPWIIAGVAAAVVVVLLAAAIIYLLRQPSTISQPSTTSQPSTQVTAVAGTALERLWLSPDQINTALGATGMTVAGTTAAMGDSSANVADKACLPMQGPAEATVYAGSGWSAVRGQALREPGDNWIHGVDQYVVLFSSAHDAGAFFTASAQRWAACAYRQYTVTLPGQPDHVVITGPVSNTNGTLSATQTFKAVNGIGTCQRALTVANNVAIDVATCFNNVPAQPDSAVNIAHQIAAKVPL